MLEGFVIVPSTRAEECPGAWVSGYKRTLLRHHGAAGGAKWEATCPFRYIGNSPRGEFS